LKRRYCIPAKENARFVWRMEDVLDVYQRPYDPKRPQVCLDEASTQLLAEARPALPMQFGQPLRQDYEYVRQGTASLFMCFEPLGGRRHVQARARRTKLDFAYVIKDLVDLHYPEADGIVLVLDNLNTHTPASLYEAFPPAEAKRLADKLEIHYTPEHGSWLNMAEIELSVVGRQCLKRRLPDLDTLCAETRAWEATRNGCPARVDWRFTTNDARIRLKRLYPSIQH
jgi:hypothetical protein